jgi:hypothetical protein
LRHAPTSLEREILTLGNLFTWQALTDGADLAESRQPRHLALSLVPCTRGPMVCLADDIRPEEWRWLRETWNLAFADRPMRVLGATVVWSGAALDRHLEEFPGSRCWSAHRWSHALATRGAPVIAAVDARYAEGVSGALLVPNPRFWSASELERIIAHASGPVILLGAPNDDLPEPAVGFADGLEQDATGCAVYGAPAGLALPPAAAALRSMDREFAATRAASALPRHLVGEEIREPLSFLEDLTFAPMSDPFLDACAEVIRCCAGAPRVIRGSERVRVAALELEGGGIRLLIGNDGQGYTIAGIDLGRPIARLQVRSRFPLFPVAPAGMTFQVKVPGRGAVVLDAELG